MLGSCNAALRTVFENYRSTSNTTPASYDVTSLGTTKPKKHPRLADIAFDCISLNYLGKHKTAIPGIN